MLTSLMVLHIITVASGRKTDASEQDLVQSVETKCFPSVMPSEHGFQDPVEYIHS